MSPPREIPLHRVFSIVALSLSAGAIALLVGGGCGNPTPGKTAPPPQAAAPSANSPKPTGATDKVIARVRVVDFDHKPLANMQPIATEQPNAWDKPAATGELTRADGSSTVILPTNTWLYVRAWDPTRRYFANNYYDVLPGGGRETEVMEVVMVPSASLEAMVTGVDGSPIAGEPVGLMLEHPTRGPWWPDESTTDATGAVRFSFLPAGKYTLTLELRDGRHIDVPDVALPPGGSANLDTVQVQ